MHCIEYTLYLATAASKSAASKANIIIKTILVAKDVEVFKEFFGRCELREFGKVIPGG
jgi:hypothetical protein